jgi:hypothetical protein
VDSRSDIKEAIRNSIASRKTNAADLAKVRQAWRQADASIARGVKRCAEGLDNEALDDPLQEEVFKAITKTFRQFYNWPGSFDSRRIGCDALHGRFRREFERRQPGMYTILKAKPSAKRQREGQVKKTKLSEGLELVQAAKEVGDGPASLSKWFTCFDIVVNTWAVTGCFDIQYLGVARKYANWSEVSAYMFEFTSKANELKDKHHQDKSIFYSLSTQSQGGGAGPRRT